VEQENGTDRGRAHNSQPVVDTTTRGGCYGRGGRGCPGCVDFSSRSFIFPHDFSVFVAVLRLKDECIWLHLGTLYTSIPLFHHFFI